MKKYTLEKRMRTSFILVFTCTLLVIMLIMAVLIRRVYRTKSYGMCEELASLNLTLLNSQIMDIQQTQDIIGKNAAVREAVSYFSKAAEKDYLAELKIQRSLDDVFYTQERSSGIWNAYIIDTGGQCLYSYIRSLKVGLDMREIPWFSQLLSQIKMNTCYVSDVHDRSYLVTEADGECVSMVIPIQSKSGYAFRPDAYLVCDIDLNTVLYGNEAYGAGTNDMRFGLIDGNGYLYSGSGDIFTEEETRQLLSLAEKTEEETPAVLLNQHWLDERIMVSIQSKLYGWHIIGIKNLRELHAMDTALLSVFALTSLAAVIIIILLSRQIARSILNPMNHLIAACNRVSCGDYQVEFPEAPSEEISILSHTVDSMVKSVNRLTMQVVEEEKNLSHEKMKVLQHQINPHFLNNVLQSVKAMAVEGENEKISRMATLLGKFLSYSVYFPYENVLLNEELNYLETYLEIQNIRFHDDIIYSVSCEPALASVTIPKLTLQPVAENAIEHGYEGKGKLLLDISAERAASYAEIYIHDNGRGITDDALQSLTQKLEKGEACQSGKSIGLINVNARLKRLYGPKYGLTLTSRPGLGTTVIIRIPAKENM